MPVETIYEGRKLEIRAWVIDGRCLVMDFLTELQQDENSDYLRLINLIQRTGDNGPIKNINHMRPLGDGIFEMKGTKTSRILFFYDEGKLIICSHGFTGKRGSEKRDVANQLKKASKIRDEYFKERKQNNG